MMMKKVILLLLLLTTTPLFARGKLQGTVERGGLMRAVVSATGIISGLGSGTLASLNRVYPSATVTVYNAGTLTLATLYNNVAGTTLSNPFSADTTGAWFFWAEDGSYDVQFSNGGITAPWTLTGLVVNGQGGTFGVGSHTGFQEPASFATPSSLGVVDGSSSTPSTNVNPEVTITRVSSQNSTPGVPQVAMHFTKAGGTGGMEGLSLWMNQTAPYAANQGSVGIYVRGAESSVPVFPNLNAFWGVVSELQRFVRVEQNAAEFDASTVFSMAVTAATNATPIQITISVAYDLRTGDTVLISGVGGNAAANGTWTITRVSTTQFTLNGSVGSGAYTSGGTVVLNAQADYSTGDGNRTMALQLVGKGVSKNTVGLGIAASAGAEFYNGITVAAGSIDSNGAAFKSDADVVGVNLKGAVATRRRDVTLVNGNNNNIAIGGSGFIRTSGPSGAFQITGFTGGIDGRILEGYIIGGTLTVAHLNSGGGASAAGSQTATLTGAGITCTAGLAWVRFVYDAASSAWIFTQRTC
jgi:hypothetical protein